MVDGVIQTDLYRKKTDKVQYLLPSSCHPSHIFSNIPYSLALRLVRICSTKEALNKRFDELKMMLLSRQYNKNIVNAAVDKEKTLYRNEILKKVIKPESKRVILILRYHPKLTSISGIVKKHWTTLTKDPLMKQMFPDPPMLAFSQPPNLRSMLVRAKHPSNSSSKPNRTNLGMQRCNKPCKICSYIKETKNFTSNQKDEEFTMNGDFNCNTTGVIYLISCNKCAKQYVGQTSRKLQIRVKEHINDIKNNKDTACGSHFNSRGHSLDNLRVQVIEKVMPNNPHTLLEREKLWIQTLSTRHPNGLNAHD